MKKLFAVVSLVAVLSLTNHGNTCWGESMKPANLRCEYLENPIGIDNENPSLNWRLESDARGDTQSAFRILVASRPELLTEEEGDLWDTGKVESAESLHHAYSGKPRSYGDRCFWKSMVWNKDDAPSSWSEPASWSLGPLKKSDWEAKWVGAEAPEEPTDDPLPAQRLRKEFEIEGPVENAIVYVSALGVYELRINGKRVGDHLLAPEWTDYHKRVQYQAYNIAPLLREGKNAISAHLGDGWYSGRIGLTHIVPEGRLRAHYGPRPRLIVQLDINSGKRRVVTDESWRASEEGPIRNSDILDGEVYDARRESPGWDEPEFDDSAWSPVHVMEEYGGKLEAQSNEPIRAIRELDPIEISEPEPGVYVFDLGQNMVGRCRIRVGGKAGQEIRLRHAEVLNLDGTIYRDNLRMPEDGGPLGARQEDRYICRGEGVEVYEPRFTFHGFRYVEVVGLTEKPGLDFLTGRVFCSSAPETGSFECSDPTLNQLMSNILWTHRANLLGVPTDCPQRDERLGWTGDAQVFAPAACFNMDMAAFFAKWLQDVRDAQAEDGRLPDFAPHPFDPNERFSGVPGWGDAGTVVPWVVYQWYGDKSALETSFNSARAWVDWIHKENPDLVWKNSRGNDYGDWLNADTFIREDWPKSGGEIPKEVFATLEFANSASLLSKMARAIGREEEAKEYANLAEKIKQMFLQEFVSEDGRIDGNTQAGYALALAFDMLPPELETRAVDHMVEALEEYNNHISTGFISTTPLMKELTKRGKNDLAYRLLNNKTFPSWGYTIEQGATTIWERWDGFVEGHGFQDPGMNSFSHYAIGSVGEWMYRTILGINPDEEAPGFRNVILRPQPGGGITWAKGSYESIRGPIEVDWRLEESSFRFDVELPANTTAMLYLPAGETDRVLEGGESVGEARAEEGFRVLELGSGAYSFAVEAK